jgi:hypothetical protein
MGVLSFLLVRDDFGLEQEYLDIVLVEPPFSEQ